MKKKKGRVGSSLDDFLKEEGIYEAVTARALERASPRHSPSPSPLPSRERTAATPDLIGGSGQVRARGSPSRR